MSIYLNFLISYEDIDYFSNLFHNVCRAANQSNLSYHFSGNILETKKGIVHYFILHPKYEITHEKLKNFARVFKKICMNNSENIIKYLVNCKIKYKEELSHLYFMNEAELIDLEFNFPDIKYNITQRGNIINFRDMKLNNKFLFIAFNVNFYDHVKRTNILHLFEHVLGYDITKIPYSNINGSTHANGLMEYHVYNSKVKELDRSVKKLLSNLYKLRYIDITEDREYIKEIRHQIDRHRNELYSTGNITPTEKTYSHYLNHQLFLQDIAYFANSEFRIYAFDFDVDYEFLEELEKKYPRRSDLNMCKQKIPALDVMNLTGRLFASFPKSKYLDCLKCGNAINNNVGFYYFTFQDAHKCYIITDESLKSDILIALLSSYPSFYDLCELYGRPNGV